MKFLQLSNEMKCARKKTGFFPGFKKALVISGFMTAFAVQAQAQTSNVSGAVFNDVNRNTRIDAGESFISLPVPLYVYLVRLNAVVDSAHVAANGTYTLQAPNGQTYTLELSAQQYAIGTNVVTTPVDHTPPTGWATTGENTSGTNTGNGDSNPNGIMQVTVTSTNLVARNFGIACKRAGTSGAFDICANEPSVIPLDEFITGEDAGGIWSYQTGSGMIFNAGAGTVQLTSTATTSTYRYDLAATTGCPASSSTATVTVRQIPVTTQSLTICAGDSVCIIHPGTGARTLHFNEKVCYTSAGTYTDTLIAATQSGCDSIVITTLTVNNCGSVNITGSVFNDANSNTIINAGETFTTLPVQLYIYLVNSNNIIVDSAIVAANGSYLVQASPDQTYTLKLSTQQYPLGTAVTTTPVSTTLPANWMTTGENGNNNTGAGDGTPDGALTVMVGTGNVSNQNFGIAPSSVLPVNLFSFEAIKINSGVQLNWLTASDQINKGFDIERSADGSRWTKIGFVNSKSEDGNRNVNADYTFIDRNAAATGKNYYRLKQLDRNGGFTYSAVAVITLTEEHHVSVYPNPVSDVLIIDGIGHNAVISIMNTLGQRLSSRAVKSNEHQVRLNVSNLSAGVYYIVVTQEDEKVMIRQKFIKQ